MTPDERMKLLKQYEQFSDPQILSMLADSPESFVEGAYFLLQEEARRRGLGIALQQSQPEESSPVPQEKELKKPQDVDTYAELVIINSEQDKVSVDSILGKTGIQYYFQDMSFRRVSPLPVALMVAEEQAEDAIVSLKEFHPRASIILW